MSINRVIYWAILVAAMITSAAEAETSYWRIASDRVTVMSSGSSERCARLAAELIAFERILRQEANWDASYELPPVTVYAISQQDARRVFLSEAERKQQAVTRFQIFSKYLPDRDSTTLALVDVGGIDDPLQSIFLMYAEGLLTNGPTLHDPPWYQFGIANLFNGLIIRSDGSALLNRNVPFEPMDSGKHVQHESYGLPKLLRIGTADLNAGGDFKSYLAAAREWAQFGLLTGEQRRSQYRELALQMRQGAPADEAVKAAFGKSLDELTSEFATGNWRYQVQFRINPIESAKPFPEPVKLESGEAEALLRVLAARAQRGGADQP